MSENWLFLRLNSRVLHALVISKVICMAPSGSDIICGANYERCYVPNKVSSRLYVNIADPKKSELSSGMNSCQTASP